MGSLENWIFKEGGTWKAICRGNRLKKGAWTVCRFQGGFGKKEGEVFLGGVDTPMHTMSKSLITFNSVLRLNLENLTYQRNNFWNLDFTLYFIIGMVAAIKALNSILLVIWGQFELLRKFQNSVFWDIIITKYQYKRFWIAFWKVHRGLW